MGVADSLEVEKLSYRGTVGQVEMDDNGNYLPDTYKLDMIRVRFPGSVYASYDGRFGCGYRTPCSE